jgi:ubiquitin-activating enzyme E1
LIDSGTLGPKGNTQVVVPHLTENYGASNDPPEKSIPLCTLHHFPNQIEHCIQWARDKFQGIFTGDIESIVAYRDQPGFLDSLDSQSASLKLTTLRSLKANLILERPRSFADCIRWARLRFEENFYNAIAQLLYTFPPDMKTTEGLPFWHPPKRCPHPVCFDLVDDEHYNFIRSAASLRAFNFGVKPSACERAEVEAVLQSLSIPAFKPSSSIKVKDKDEPEPEPEASPSAAPALDEDQREIAALMAELPKPEELKKNRC